MSARRMLVVGAHSADFVWRAAGAIAKHTSAGGEAIVVALSYGERGESGALWKEPGQTEENVKRIRHEEAEKAAKAVGASFQGFAIEAFVDELATAAGKDPYELRRALLSDHGLVADERRQLCGR